MIPSPSSRRHIIPRWRSLSRTIASRELSSPAGRYAPFELSDLSPEFVLRLEEWRIAPSVITAAELVEAAIVHAQEREAVGAARLLVQERSGATSLVRKNAALVLKRTGHEADIPADVPSDSQDTAHIWRVRTRLHPHDALGWVELALAQLSAQHDDNALRSMRVALHLAPGNRHVLRSASRLFLHMHDPEQAHDLIRRNKATPQDPWLMAAEIALAPQAGRTPTFFSKGVSTLEQDTRPPHQITELAGALGTNLLADGNRKRGRRMLQRSLTDPTGNSLAQAEWASQTYGEVFVKQAQLQTSTDAKEAMTFHLFHSGNFESSLAHASSWIEEEPFSSRAYRAAAATASILEDYKTAERMAQNGLKHDPTSLELASNLAFALACQGKLIEAKQLVKTLARASEGKVIGFVAEANRGLIAFRDGRAFEGKACYQKAIAGFARKQHLGAERLARAYFAREAALAGLPDAPDILAEGENKNRQTPLSHVSRVLQAARSVLKHADQTQPAAGPDGPSDTF